MQCQINRERVPYHYFPDFKKNKITHKTLKFSLSLKIDAVRYNLKVFPHVIKRRSTKHGRREILIDGYRTSSIYIILC